MHELTPDEEMAEVEEANNRFYRAIENLDLPAMDQVWSHGDHVRCIHPGWGKLDGWEAVRQSWEAIFKDTREMRFTLEDVQIRIGGDVAWLTCSESILSQEGGNISVTTVLTTNLFEREAGEWRMVLHHASHILASESAGETP